MSEKPVIVDKRVYERVPGARHMRLTHVPGDAVEAEEFARIRKAEVAAEAEKAKAVKARPKAVAPVKEPEPAPVEATSVAHVYGAKAQVDGDHGVIDLVYDETDAQWVLEATLEPYEGDVTDEDLLEDEGACAPAAEDVPAEAEAPKPKPKLKKDIVDRLTELGVAFDPKQPAKDLSAILAAAEASV